MTSEIDDHINCFLVIYDNLEYDIKCQVIPAFARILDPRIMERLWDLEVLGRTKTSMIASSVSQSTNLILGQQLNDK